MTDKEKKLIYKVAQGLIDIAELVMPESYFATDSRVKAARKLLKWLKSH